MSVVTFSRAGIAGGMEEVLIGSPDDVCLHQALATALLCQGDDASTARGRLIQTQIKLEDPRLNDEDRKKLVNRERKLIRDHRKTWLGELAEWLCQDTYSFTLWRGWLHTVEAPELNPAFIEALAHAPIARLLRKLVIADERPGGPAALAALVDSPPLATLKELRLGVVGAGEVPGEVLCRLLGSCVSGERGVSTP
jgi:hypothetical protein